MSYANYRAGIAAIAACEAEGEDVSGRIAHLAAAARVERSMVRHEVTEHAELG